jgi:uncharacterized membrane protein YphA (DoxX/SURF4 family)
VNVQATRCTGPLDPAGSEGLRDRWKWLGGGSGWTKRGYANPLMWGPITLAIALRGGGAYSLDRRVGKQL